MDYHFECFREAEVVHGHGDRYAQGEPFDLSEVVLDVGQGLIQRFGHLLDHAQFFLLRFHADLKAGHAAVDCFAHCCFPIGGPRSPEGESIKRW